MKHETMVNISLNGHDIPLTIHEFEVTKDMLAHVVEMFGMHDLWYAVDSGSNPGFAWQDAFIYNGEPTQEDTSSNLVEYSGDVQCSVMSYSRKSGDPCFVEYKESCFKITESEIKKILGL